MDSSLTLPLSVALASIFIGIIFISILLARKIPLKLCVVQGDELRVFVSLGKVLDPRVECFDNAKELRNFATSSGANLSGLRESISMVLAIRKVFLTIAALGAIGLAISISLALISLALGA